MAVNVSLKRVQINKANTTMVVATAIAAFLLTFSLIAGRALLNKRSYQAKVISAKEKAVNQLRDNITATNSLVNSYKAFVSTSSNVLGGNPAGTGDKDGDNAKIVLDALPSQYDFPALASSLEKLMTDNGFKINAIGGTDDEVAQQGKQSSATPETVEMPFEFSATTDINGSKNLFALMQRSIRPLKVKTVDISGSNSNLTVDITGISYYQPEKSLDIEMKVVK